MDEGEPKDRGRETDMKSETTEIPRGRDTQRQAEKTSRGKVTDIKRQSRSAGTDGEMPEDSGGTLVLKRDVCE